MFSVSADYRESNIGFLFRFSKEIEIKLSCGRSVTIKTEDLKRNIPCPCGNPNHWIVKWETIE